MGKLTDFLNGVSIGQAQRFGNMSVYPLHMKNGHQRGYQTLDEALAAQSLAVMEVSEGGSVPTLKVRNTGKLPVLMVVGEELVGAKQNRVLNTSLLVPAEQETQIPVSCVEQGRWSYRSRHFGSTGTTSSHMTLRKMHTANVTDSLRSSRIFDSKQGEVWREVKRKISSTKSISGTHALHDVYEQTEHQLKDYLEAFQPPEAQGMLVAINGEVVGADLFDHEETLRMLWPKLMRSYALDALEHASLPQAAEQPSPADLEETQRFITSALQAKDEEYDSVGLGKDVRLSSDKLTGSGLLWEGKLIHASLFKA
ncbi:MAG: hypothetical protein IT324_26330 [Anaerolineae bacterium]|nr:hypothetical protein [Anaerolineae bacterium]